MKRNTIMHRAVRGVRRNYQAYTQLAAARYPDATRRFQPIADSFAKPKIWATTATLAVITLVAVNVATQTQQTPRSSAAVPTQANLWVEPGAGNCTRSGNAVSYSGSASPDARCGSLNNAWQAAAAGDVIVVRSGSYGNQAFTTRAQAMTSPGVTFHIEDRTAFGSINFGDEGTWGGKQLPRGAHLTSWQ